MTVQSPDRRLQAVVEDARTYPADGYQYIPNLLNTKDCFFYAGIAVHLWQSSLLHRETDRAFYHESHGAGSLYEFEDLLVRLTPKVSQLLGAALRPVNSYVRIYQNGSMLNRHTDRVSLDHTISVTLANTMGWDWPLHVETADGSVAAFTIPVGDAVALRGRQLPHWREPLTCSPDDYVVQLFLHWN